MTLGGDPLITLLCCSDFTVCLWLSVYKCLYLYRWICITHHWRCFIHKLSKYEYANLWFDYNKTLQLMVYYSNTDIFGWCWRIYILLRINELCIKIKLYLSQKVWNFFIYPVVEIIYNMIDNRIWLNALWERCSVTDMKCLTLLQRYCLPVINIDFLESDRLTGVGDIPCCSVCLARNVYEKDMSCICQVCHMHVLVACHHRNLIRFCQYFLTSTVIFFLLCEAICMVCG